MRRGVVAGIRDLVGDPVVRDGIVVGFGVLSVAQTMAMSLLVFTGASQFAAVGVIASGGTAAAAVGSALLLAARNGFYAITMSRYITGPLWRRGVAAHLTIDESTALGTTHDDPAAVRRGFWAGGLSVFTFWNLGTLLGAVGGDAIGDPATYGLDAAFPAGFVALMAGALGHRPGRLAAAAGFVIAVVLVPFVRPGIPILAAALGAVLALAVAGPPPSPAQTPAP